MGLVYLAVHEALHKQVALKVLGTMSRVDREVTARFEREAIAAANLKHPNIAEATDFGQLPDGGLYLVMEYVEGTTLRRLVAEQGKLAPERALVILQQVGAALAAAHARDVVHRDLKPENVVVTPASSSSGSGAGDVVKVIDFGVAKLRSATFGGGGTGLTSAGTVIGTPEYMSPEQVMGQAVDARSDQYALGVLAFELLTGKQPYKTDDIGQLMMMHVGAPVPSTRELTPGLPAAMDSAIMRMLAKLPDERFASVTEALEALAGAPTQPAGPSAAAIPAPITSNAQTNSAPASAREFHQATLPSPKADVVAPRALARRWQLPAIGVAVLLVGALIVALLLRSPKEAATLPPELTAAVGDWNDGKFEPAGAAIGKVVLATPSFAELESLSRPLAAPVGDDSARRAVTKLLETTELGRSRAMASALAEVAVGDEPARRDVALNLLRNRQDLLSDEQAARVRLRDASTCEDLDTAKAAESQVGTEATRRDLERLGLSECKTMLLVSRLCDACTGGRATPRPGAVTQGKPVIPAAPAPPPSPPDHGNGNGHGRGNGRK
jgi:serine/threonine-protein kinase